MGNGSSEESVISDQSENTQFMDCLLKIGLPIVEMPAYQLSVLQKAPRPPTAVRDWLRQKIMGNNRGILQMINALDSKEQRLLIEYLLTDLRNMSTQQLMLKSDFPQCLHMMHILPVFGKGNGTHKLRVFWCNDQMESDIAEQIFGTNEYTEVSGANRSTPRPG